MAISKFKLDKKLLQTFEPFADLGYDKLDELLSKAVIADYPAGQILFKQGESDKRTQFLVNGQIDLLETGKPKAHAIKAKSKEAKLALVQELPRPCSARTKTEATILSIDTDLLEILLDDNPSGTYEVDELGDDSGYWMTRFLQSRAFLQLPTENIQTLLMAMEEVPVNKGDVIVHQGERDNYYYIVQSGKCSVSRRPTPNAEELQLAILKEGDGFGEEALIMNGKRNANITMLEDGQLMRLSKDDFMTYLASPLIKYTEEKDVLQSISKGSLLIDVRSHNEYEATHVEGSVNIPLSMLRLKLDGLNSSRDYILCCSDGTRSSAAAFLLTQHGVTCHVLKGGLEKANIKLPDANLSVSVVPTDNKKVQAANHNQQVAKEKAEKIQQQAKKASDEASLLTRRVAEAEALQRKAEQEVVRLQQEEAKQRDNVIRSEKMRAEKEAQHAKQAEEKAAKLKLEAKVISDRANEELNKIKQEADKIAKHQQSLDEASKRAIQISAEAEKAAAQARQQAEKEAIEIRQHAEAEAKLLRAEMEETTRKILANAKKANQEDELKRRAAMDVVRQKEKEAEKLRQQAQLEADALRQKTAVEGQAEIEAAKIKATKEAEEIRRQAQKEAEKMRAELLSAQEEFQNTVTNAKQEERQQRQRLLEEAQQHAQDVINETTLKAERDAEDIRIKAENEAEQLHKELELARKQIEESHASVSEVERIRRESLLDETRKQAQDLLQKNVQRAAEEAEQIRQQALTEADQLRTELTNARKQIEDTVSQSHTVTGQQRENIINQAQEHAQHVINEATLKAEQKAEAIRHQAHIEAKDLRMELERARLQLADQAAMVKQEQQRKEQQVKKQAQQQEVSNTAQKQEQARKMAEQIRAKLEQAESQRQENEAQTTGAGMSLSEVKVRRANDRIILEGAEDIFIFKEPSAVQDEIPVLDEVSSHQNSTTNDNELPSFEVDGHDAPVATPFNSQEFKNARRERDATISMAQNAKRKHVFTIAASVVITIAAGATFLIYKPQLEQQFIADKSEAPQLTAKASINPVANLKKAIEIPPKLTIKSEESKLSKQAEETFNTLVKKWKELAAGSFETDQPKNTTEDKNTSSEN